jgi:hypothetical protein
MLKRLMICCFVLVLPRTLMYGQEFAAAAGISFPYEQQSYNSGDKKTIQGTGITLSFRSLPDRDPVGFFGSFDLFFPRSVTFGTGSDSVTVSSSDYDSYWGCSVMTGAFGYIIRRYTWAVPCGLGGTRQCFVVCNGGNNCGSCKCGAWCLDLF